LKVSTESVATREVLLTFEPEQATIRRAMRQAARQISRVRPVSGYRPGKAPYGMVERIFGRDVILNEALNTVAPDLFREAVKEAGIEPYEQGQLDVESEDPLVLKINVSLTPTVELGDCASLSIEPEPEVVVTDEQIDQAVEAERRRHAEYETVERPAEINDQIVAKVVGTSDGDQVVDQENATMLLDDELAPPGFAEALAGMSAEDTREFSLTYPEDFGNDDLAGKNVDFEVTVATVRKVDLPDVDDDLAKMAGDYDTLTEMRDGLAERIKRGMEYESQQKEQAAAIEALVGVATLEYPAAALRDEVDNALGQQRSRLEQMGFTWENYLRMTGRNEGEIREEMQQEAERRLTNRLVLTQYARQEELSLTSEEISREMNTFAASVASAYGERAEEMMQQLRQNGTLTGVVAEALTRKAMGHLTDRLTGRETEEAGGTSDDGTSADSTSEDSASDDSTSGDDISRDDATAEPDAETTADQDTVSEHASEEESEAE